MLNPRLSSKNAGFFSPSKTVSRKPSRITSISDLVGRIPSMHASFHEVDQKSGLSFGDEHKSTSFSFPKSALSIVLSKKKRPFRQLTDQEKNFFASLDDDEFEAIIAEVKREHRTVSVENQLFEDFLYVNEPTLLSNYQNVLVRIEALNRWQPLAILDFRRGVVESDLSNPNKINLSQRVDLIMRKSEEMVDALQKFVQKSKMEKFLLQAETEAYGFKVNDYEYSKQCFEQEVVTRGVDPITQKIPAEKWFRYMSDWQKSAIVMTEKLRLGNMSLKQELVRLIQLYRQKVFIGESVQEIDFEQLIITARGLKKKLEDQSTAVVSTKHMCGLINLRKAKSQSYMMKIMRGLTLLRKERDRCVHDTEDMRAKAVLTQKELDKARRECEAVVHMIGSHRVPSVLDYLRVKATLDGHKKDIKVLNRKTNLINIMLDTRKKLLKHAPTKSANNLQALDDESDFDPFLHPESQSYMAVDEPLPFDIMEILHKANA